jgi:predicted acetyltransferase
MNIRKADLRDRPAAESLWAYCFEKPSDPFFQWYFSDVCRMDEVLLGESGGRTACSLHRRPYSLSLRGRVMPVDYLVGVATHPAARGRGMAGRLLEGAFRTADEEGKPAVILMPSDAALYSKAGFAFYAHQWRREAAPERLAPLGRRSSRSGVPDSSGDWADMDDIYRDYTAGRQGWALRDEAFWKLHLEGQMKEGYAAVVYGDTGPSGYLWYSIEDRVMTVSEMAFRGEEGRRGLYAYMAGHRGSVDRCIWYEPLDDRSFLYWQDGAEHTYIENRTFPFMMCRLTDPSAAFSGCACPPDMTGGVTLALEDPVLRDKSGLYRLSCENGMITAERALQGEPALCLREEGAAQMLFGAASVEELLRRGWAESVSRRESSFREAVNWLSRAFPRRRTWINEWY